MATKSKSIKVLMPSIAVETEKAYGFMIGEEKKVGKSKYISVPTYFPKSLCVLDGEYLTMPMWLAKKTGCHLALKHGNAQMV